MVPASFLSALICITKREFFSRKILIRPYLFETCNPLGKAGLVAIRHCPLCLDSLPPQPFVAKGRSKASLHSAGRTTESHEIKQLPALFGGLVLSVVLCKMVCKNSPQNKILCFPWSPVGLTAFLRKSLKMWQWQVLNRIGNRSFSLETGCHLYACLFPSLLLSLLHILLHKPSAIQVLCDFTSRALSGCLHQLKICCRKTALIGTEGEEKQKGRTLHHIFEKNACE